jgi:hypothetical protein
VRKRATRAGEGAEAPGPEKRSWAEIFRFGERLIDTKDLDPVYVAIWGAKLESCQLSRLLLAYWCFYHLGAAAYISEFEARDFWSMMARAAVNEEFWCPRGAERRHFRGPKCVTAVKWLEAHSPAGRPDELLDALITGRVIGRERPQALTVMTRIQYWPMFGPWIAFKAADMIDRLILPVEFNGDFVWLYAEPRAGLDLLPAEPQEATNILLQHFRKFTAPPQYERRCGIQEVETILCKFKSYVNGHYYIGKDIKEMRAGLAGWGRTADRLLAAAPAYNS